MRERRVNAVRAFPSGECRRDHSRANDRRAMELGDSHAPPRTRAMALVARTMYPYP